MMCLQPPKHQGWPSTTEAREARKLPATQASEGACTPSHTYVWISDLQDKPVGGACYSLSEKGPLPVQSKLSGAPRQPAAPDRHLVAVAGTWVSAQCLIAQSSALPSTGGTRHS